MTNREWLESLTDKQLAEFLTLGLKVEGVYIEPAYYYVNISRVASQYTQSALGIEDWLKQPQQFFLPQED